MINLEQHLKPHIFDFKISQDQCTHHSNERVIDPLKLISEHYSLDSLTDNQMQFLHQDYLKHEYQNIYNKQIKRSKFTPEVVDMFIKNWLDDYTSEETRRAFKRNLDRFLNWLNGITIFDVNSYLVDKYVGDLKRSSNLNKNSIRLNIASCSSFWSKLVRWEAVDRNPFLHARKPNEVKQTKTSDDVPTNAELDYLEQLTLDIINNSSGKGSANKIKGAMKGYCVAKIMRSTGLRIGAIQKLIIHRNGDYEAETKGGIAHGKLSQDILQILKNYGFNRRTPFQHYCESSFRTWMNRIQDTKEWQENIGHKFTIHGIRHRFAINFYNKSFNIKALSIMLGHSDIRTTDRYLQTLHYVLDTPQGELNFD